VELSWYGDQPVTVDLGGAFHARRLSVRASQVGAVAAARRSRRSYQDRMALALRLLQDPVFDVLISSQGSFAELPGTMRRLAAGDLDALCHVVNYGPRPRTVHNGLQEV
jgi:hypothetical protein